MLCDNLDTTFEDCMAALNCKMKTEMAVGGGGSEIVTFYQQMIPHHANAINMARVLLKTTDLSKEPFAEQLMNGELTNNSTSTCSTVAAALCWSLMCALTPD